MEEIIKYTLYIVGIIIGVANFGMAVEWLWSKLSKIINAPQTAKAKPFNPHQTYPQKIKRFLINFSALITAFIVLAIIIVQNPAVTLPVVFLCCYFFMIISIYIAGFFVQKLKKEVYVGLRYLSDTAYVPPNDPGNEDW